MFKPKLSFDSQELLVQQYKHLRQRDTGGSAKSSWRITVRQLESMLRLSEAFARLHCSDTVSKKHVQEAYRLLNKSIIRYIIKQEPRRVLGSCSRKRCCKALWTYSPKMRGNIQGCSRAALSQLKTSSNSIYTSTIDTVYIF